MNAFWNAAEHRLRAGWRMLLQAAIIYVLTVGSSLGIDAALGERGLATRVLARTSMTLLVITLSIWLGGRLLDRRRFADFGLCFDRANRQSRRSNQCCAEEKRRSGVFETMMRSSGPE
jgi:hypothetical protein